MHAKEYSSVDGACWWHVNNTHTPSRAIAIKQFLPYLDETFSPNSNNFRVKIKRRDVDTALQFTLNLRELSRYVDRVCRCKTQSNTTIDSVTDGHTPWYTLKLFLPHFCMLVPRTNLATGTFFLLNYSSPGLNHFSWAQLTCRRCFELNGCHCQWQLPVDDLI